ncbi:MAG: DUF3333 domain-containing protein, partial [Gammaproteobacteria bacterium]|nr:DUF3333 domain-containing protein [Gammaproteobacteria bacterium]
MSDVELPADTRDPGAGSSSRARVQAGLARRYAREHRFRWYGMLSVVFGMSFLGFLLVTIVGNGYTAFRQTHVRLEVVFDEAVLDPSGEYRAETLAAADYQVLIRAALTELFPEVTERKARRELASLVSSGAAYQLRDMLLASPALLGERRSVWLIADDQLDILIKGTVGRSSAEGGQLSERQLGWIDLLMEQERIELRFNRAFFTAGDSREPELAGIWGATKGSFFMLLVTLLLSFPLGVAAAIYLEEFAPRNRWVD